MNNKIYSLFISLFISIASSAQYNLQIEITTSSSHNNDSVFVAGNFNGWNPSDNQYLFSKENGKSFLIIKNLAAGTYQFKFTRGSWGKVETTATGGGIENRFIKLSSDTTIKCSIAEWSDDFARVEPKHTASENVHLLDTAFFIPQLNKSRRIWIYLPKGYGQSTKKYPVMYLHDGQNLFDAFNSSFGNEWGVDECLDTLIAKGKPACIVVGIDNGGQSRMSEYNPYDFVYKTEGGSQTFAAQGEEYIIFLAQTLKPFIDKHYKTLPSKENTIIAGSSMGGLISYYAAIKYADVFGKAGVFSPAFWTAPAIKPFTDVVTNKLTGKFFFYIGAKEGDKYVSDMKEVAEKLGAKSNAMIYTVIDPEGQHNEIAWRKWFAEFYNWVMADGFNGVIKL